MAKGELGSYVGGTDVGGIGERSVEGALLTLLRLTGDAVITFDGSGTILYANEQAARLFWHSKAGLVGLDVRLLFPPSETEGMSSRNVSGPLYGAGTQTVDAQTVGAQAVGAAAVGTQPVSRQTTVGPFGPVSPSSSEAVPGYADARSAQIVPGGAGSDARKSAPFSGNDFDPAALPFAVDGSATVLTCAGTQGLAVQVRVRCDRVHAPDQTFLLVARQKEDADVAQGEKDRLVEELSRANKRLEGTLDIVLGTIDSVDVGTLFSRALNEVTRTMEADGTIMYLAESDGFHLRGKSDGMSSARVPRFMPYGRSIETLATQEGHTLRMRVLPPERDELRQGRLHARRVLDEQTRHVHKVAGGMLPPFTSFLAVPVWFGGHVIALMECGWASTHPTRMDDAQLLDAVAQYLSVQLMGAFSAMTAQRRDQLAATSSELREKLMAADSIDAALLTRTMARAAQQMGATLVVLVPMEDGYLLQVLTDQSLRALPGPSTQTETAADLEVASGSSGKMDGRPEGSAVPQTVDYGTAGTGTTGRDATSFDSADRGATASGAAPQPAQPASESLLLPLELVRDLLSGKPQPRAGATAIRGSEPFSDWLRDHGLSPVGALVDLGEVDGQRYRALVLRGSADPVPGEPEPLSDLEFGFLDSFAQDVSELVAGGKAHDQDKRIAQALQSGMRNELQDVKGISAQGLYSSATAQAFVGGDFYDLIRLPGRRACVIMGDVSGKGVEAASVSAAVRTALGAYAWEGLRPARMVRSLNDFLLGFSRIETFATLFVGIIDLERATLTYCSAGHPPAVLMHASTGELTLLDVQSGVVGAFKDILYQDGRVRIEPGDMLLLYTDGTTEARSPDGSFFGEEGLRDAVMAQWQKGFDGIVDRLLAMLDRFTDNNLDDDVAMVALRFDEVGKKDRG